MSRKGTLTCLQAGSVELVDALKYEFVEVFGNGGVVAILPTCRFRCWDLLEPPAGIEPAGLGQQCLEFAFRGSISRPTRPNELEEKCKRLDRSDGPLIPGSWLPTPVTIELGTHVIDRGGGCL